MTARSLFIIAADFGEGLTTHHRYLCGEHDARVYFARYVRTHSGPCALVGHGGQVLARANSLRHPS